MEGQQFCLRWHNFQNTLLSSLPKLLDGGHLTDVTLSAGGRHIHAHKIILSACSYYFKELFKDLNSLQHPVIVLPDMEYGNLCALVTFMYSGEVNIYQEQLPALLAMANTLHIRGLADIAGKNSRLDGNFCTTQSPLLAQQSQEKPSNDDITKKEPKDTISNIESADSLLLPPEISQQLEEESYNEQDMQQRNMAYCVKTTPYYSINAKLNQREKVPGLINASSGSNKYLEKRYTSDNTVVEEMVASVSDIDATASKTTEGGTTIKPNAIWDTNFKFLGTSSTSRTSSSSSSHIYNKSSVTCLVCGKQLSNQYNLRVHMETHSNSSYSCNACSHVSRSRDALRKHVSYRHPVATPQKRSRYNTPKS